MIVGYVEHLRTTAQYKDATVARKVAAVSFYGFLTAEGMGIATPRTSEVSAGGKSASTRTLGRKKWMNSWSSRPANTPEHAATSHAWTVYATGLRVRSSCRSCHRIASKATP